MELLICKCLYIYIHKYENVLTKYEFKNYERIIFLLNIYFFYIILYILI